MAVKAAGDYFIERDKIHARAMAEHDFKKNEALFLSGISNRFRVDIDPHMRVAYEEVRVNKARKLKEQKA